MNKEDKALAKKTKERKRKIRFVPKSYHRGRVRSIQTWIDGVIISSIGSMQPGTYDFGVLEHDETIYILNGFVEEDGMRFGPRGKIFVKKGTHLVITVHEAADYRCIYGK